MARHAKTWLCVAAVVVAGCSDLSGPAADSSSQPPPVPSPQAVATPPDQVSVAVTVTPAPTGTPATETPATGSPSPTPTGPTTAPAEPDDPSPPPSDPPSERELLEAEAVELTNAERAGAGCPEVHVDDRLVKAARAHSEDMVERDFFDHTNPDGDGPGDRAHAAGYDWSAISENIAWGYDTAEAVVAGWMDSPGHRRNILDCDVVAVGVGVADSSRGLYWTQLFGRE